MPAHSAPPAAEQSQIHEVEIFRAGTHIAADGTRITIRADELAALAESYNPATHEAPIILGHKVADDAPAHGWVYGLEERGGRLFARVSELSETLKELIRTGAYKKVSAAFYRAGSASNPTPGQLHLHHVGVLGAVPPAVKGLAALPASLAFSAPVKGGDVLAFRQLGGEASVLSRLWAVLRGVAERPTLLEELEAAMAAEDEALADQGAESTAASTPSSAQISVQASLVPAATQGAEATAAESVTATENKTEIETAAPALESPAAPTDAEKTETPLSETGINLSVSLSFAEHEAALRARLENEALLDGLIREGKFIAARRAETLAFMQQLSGNAPFAFSEGETSQTENPLAFFRSLLAAQPPLVMFGEMAAATDANAHSVPAVPGLALPKGMVADPAGLHLHARAEAIRAEDPATPYLAAVAKATFEAGRAV